MKKLLKNVKYAIILSILIQLPTLVYSIDTSFSGYSKHTDEGVTFLPIPADSLYPEPIADHRFPRVAVTFPFIGLNAIDTKESLLHAGYRETVEAGASRSFFRLSPISNTNIGIEISIGIGIFTMFDSFRDNLENFGWDGSAHLMIQFKPIEEFAFRFGYHHLSGHVGDEYLAEYISIIDPIVDGAGIADGENYHLAYVRDAVLLGLSFQPFPFLRMYGEVDYSFSLMDIFHCYNNLRWHINFGTELVWKPPEEIAWIGAWYAATDIQLFEESSWRPGITVQIGRYGISGEKGERFRIGAEYYYGRVPLFVFNHTQGTIPTEWDAVPLEQYITIGIWFDM
ncbi:MAG: DUF1207 domain-containing protein [Spirochaetia bacterium]|nr:DUF1207 domain-containing protein [Spirochaetia bacterium]